MERSGSARPGLTRQASLLRRGSARLAALVKGQERGKGGSAEVPDLDEDVVDACMARWTSRSEGDHGPRNRGQIEDALRRERGHVGRAVHRLKYTPVTVGDQADRTDSTRRRRRARKGRSEALDPLVELSMYGRCSEEIGGGMGPSDGTAAGGPSPDSLRAGRPTVPIQVLARHSYAI